MSMVASKAARVVLAARGKSVMEFGQRRTHPVAALDATYAAYLAGATATSNMAAYAAWGIPAYGTMDHFAIQAAEEEGAPREATEERFFRDYQRSFGGSVTFLVDTYDTERGIRSAVRAADGGPFSIRIDSSVSRESVTRARALLAELGAPHGKIFVSDGLDEHKVKDLADLVDGFGVGENISCSPDAAAGVGAVAKLVVNGYGKITMKLVKGSGKATLPGRLQVHRAPDHDLLALHDEDGPPGTHPLLRPVWRDGVALPLPSLEESRAYVARQIAALPPTLTALDAAPEPRPLVVSARLAELVRSLAEEAGA
jgi:nicotinate phosphoribosyltransferase